MQSAVPSKCGLEYPACIPGLGVENAGAMKQIRNAEQVDSGTQDVQLSGHTQPLRLVQEGSFMSPVSHRWTQ